MNKENVNIIENNNDKNKTNEYPIVDINKKRNIKVIHKKRVKTAQQNMYFKTCNDEYNAYNETIKEKYFKKIDE